MIVLINPWITYKLCYIQCYFSFAAKPPQAEISLGDCDFQRDSCGFKNITTDPNFRWSSATLARRPISLNDHTYGNPSKKLNYMILY